MEKRTDSKPTREHLARITDFLESSALAERIMIRPARELFGRAEPSLCEPGAPMLRFQPTPPAVPKKSLCDLQRLHSAALPSLHRLYPGYDVDAWSRPMGRIGGDVLAVWPVE